MTEEATGAVTTVFSNIKNNVVSQLAAPATNTDVAVSLMTGTGASFPTAPFYCSVEYEVMWCTNKVGDSLQVQRGVDGTQASAHPINAVIQIRNNAGLFLDAYDAIREIDAGVTTGAALPADLVYRDKVQELTHKTIDLTDGSKANVIIGTVQPDPASLPLTNVLKDGGFDIWTLAKSSSVPAGTPTSGTKVANLTNNWWIAAPNDSSITATRDTANIDAAFPSLYDCLVNCATVQANDVVSVYQGFGATSGNAGAPNEMSKVVGSPLSVAGRFKLISGNIQIRYRLTYRDVVGSHNILSSFTTLTGSSYTTLKFENQIVAPTATTYSVDFVIEAKGTGQFAIGSAIAAFSPVAIGFRPSFPNTPDQGPSIGIYNGGFEVWQRGNGPFSTYVYGPDGWLPSKAGTDTLAISKEAGTVDVSSNYACKAVFVLGNGAGLSSVLQQVSIADNPTMRGSVVTFSMRVACSTPNAVRLAINDYTTAARYIYSDFHSGSGLYETLSVTATMSYSDVYFQPGVYFSASCTAYLDNAMAYVGNTPLDYTPVHPVDEYVRCEGYYQIIGEGVGGNYIAAGQAVSAGQTAFVVQFRRRQVVASITLAAPAAYVVTNGVGTATAITAISASSATKGTTNINCTGSTGLVAGNASLLENWTSTGTIIVSSET